MPKKAAKFKVSVQITPVSGKSTKKTVMVPASATLREVAEAAGVKDDLEKKNFSVDGQPAKLDTRVTSLSKVEVVEVKITERPQGS